MHNGPTLFGDKDVSETDDRPPSTVSGSRVPPHNSRFALGFGPCFVLKLSAGPGKPLNHSTVLKTLRLSRHLVEMLSIFFCFFGVTVG